MSGASSWLKTVIVENRYHGARCYGDVKEAYDIGTVELAGKAIEFEIIYYYTRPDWSSSCLGANPIRGYLGRSISLLILRILLKSFYVYT